MTYKTIVISDAPKAKKMAAAIERTANEKAEEGWELVTFSLTHSAKAILVFRLPENASLSAVQEENALETEARAASLEEETAEAVVGDME